MVGKVLRRLAGHRTGQTDGAGLDDDACRARRRRGRARPRGGRGRCIYDKLANRFSTSCVSPVLISAYCECEHALALFRWLILF